MMAFLRESPVVERLGWVLIHSLWQFAVVALLAGALLRLMYSPSAVARYWVAVCLLASLAALPVVTWMVLPPDSEESRLAIEQSAMPGVAIPPGTIDSRPLSALRDSVPQVSRTASTSSSSATESTTPIPVPPRSRWSLLRQAMEPWLAWIVAAWCVGVTAFALRPLLGWNTARRLRKVGVSPVTEVVQAALERTRTRLGVRRAVQIMESTLVRVPMVVGYVRPVILLPLTIVTGLPTSQLEAIIAHELAHVRRHDYVVNLLQTLIETLCFHHPAVWWLSRRIREERENCCDDLAVLALGDRATYGRALLAIDEMRGGVPALALGASEGSLVARIRRIAGKSAERSHSSPVFSLALLASVTAIAMGLPSGSRAERPENHGEIFSYHCDIADRASDAPIPGVKITWRIVREPTPVNSPPVWEGNFTSDANGKYDVQLPKSAIEAGGSVVWITTSHPDFLPIQNSGYRRSLPDDDAGIQPDHRHLKLKRGMEVTGGFQLPDGSPAKDLVVMVARDREGFGDSTGAGFYTRTDAAGRFRLVTQNSWPQRLHWFPQEHVADSRALTKTFGDQETIRLKNGPRITGRIEDHDGKPLAGLVIQAATGTRVPLLFATSDEQGRFTFTPSPAGEYRLLPVDHYVDFEGRTQRASQPPPFDGIDCTLASDGAPLVLQAPETVLIRIKIVDAEGRPVEGRRISDEGWPPRFHSTAVADQPGVYELKVPRGQPYRSFTISRQVGESVTFRELPSPNSELAPAPGDDGTWTPGHALRLNLEDRDELDATIVSHSIRVMPEGRIQIVVRSATGEAVNVSNILFEIEYVDVEKFRALGTDGRGFTQISSVGERPGRVLEGVVPGLPMSIKLSGGGYKPAETTVKAVAGETKTVEIVLEPEQPPGLEQNINGRVLDEQGRPVAGAEVGLQTWGFDEQSRLSAAEFLATAFTNAEGNYRILVPANVDASKLLGAVWAIAPGAIPTRNNSVTTVANLIANGETIPLVKAAPTAVRILDAEGQPLRDVRVTVTWHRLPEAIAWPIPRSWEHRIEAATDAEGVARIPNTLPDAIASLRLIPEGAAASVLLDQNFFLNTRPVVEDPQFTLTLPQTGTIAGRLAMGPGIELPPDTRLTIQTESRLSEQQWTGVWGVAEVTPDRAGRFTVEGIAEGPIVVAPFLAENQPLRASLPDSAPKILSGETTELEIPVRPGIVVRGQIRKQDTQEGAPGFSLKLIYGQSANQHRSMQESFDLTTDVEGWYTATVPPGAIEVRLTSGVQGYRDAEWWSDRIGHWGTKFVVPEKPAKFDLPPIELVPSKSLKGQLVDENNKPLGDWMVYGFPEIPGKEPEHVMNSFAGVSTDEMGRFEGEYPSTFAPTRWKASHREWPTPYEFQDNKWTPQVISNDPLVLQLNLHPEEKPKERKEDPLERKPNAARAAASSFKLTALEKSTDDAIQVVVTSTDAKTGEAISKIRIVPASLDGDRRHVTWQSQYLKEYEQAPVEFRMKRGWDRTLLRIEAEGYRPFLSEPIPRNQKAALEVQLIPDSGFLGTILTPEGKPAAGASVAICTWTNEVTVENGSLRYGHHAEKLRPMAATDANGTFRTPAEVDEYVLVAAHREGYAEVTVEELAKSNTIELQPWGRLEGEYVIAGQAQADQTIQIGAGRGDVEVVLHYSGTAKTDAAGKFSSGPIPPVQLYVSPLFHHGESDFNLGWFSGSIKVVPGETTRLNLPRPGKPLVGRVVLPADSGLKLADLSLTASINLRPPRMGFGELEGEQEAYAAFMESAAGKTFHRANIPVGKDGKFRIEGLPETTYLLQISANRRGDEAAHLAAWSVTRVTLTEQTDASTVLDLGDVVLKVSPPK